MSCVPDALGALAVLSTHEYMDGPWCHGPGSVPCTAPHGCSHKKANSHPREERLFLGIHCLSISFTSLLLCPSLPGVPHVAAGTRLLLFMAHHNLLLAPSPPSAIPPLSSAPLHQWFVWSIAWIFGVEVAKLRVGNLCAARSCSAFLLVFAQLNRFLCCCCCCHENPTESCSFSEVKVAFSLPEDTSESQGWPLPYFCTDIAGCIPAVAVLCATSTLPAGICPAKSLKVGGSQGNRTLILSRILWPFISALEKT